MEQRIAIPLENGVLSSHFGHCQAFAIIEVKDGVITGTKMENPPEHTPGAYPRWIAGFGVTTVIAGGIGQKAILLFNEQNIDVLSGAPVKSANDLVYDYLANRLSLVGNYCNHDEKHHHGSCQH